MKSKRARAYANRCYKPNNYQMKIRAYSREMVDKAVELAEEEMAETACRLFEQFMSGVFQGDTPKKMAEEFKQKLME